MAAELFSWMYGDPALFMDRKRAVDANAAAWEKLQKERHRIKQARKFKKLVKLAKSGALKGKNRA